MSFVKNKPSGEIDWSKQTFPETTITTNANSATYTEQLNVSGAGYLQEFGCALSAITGDGFARYSVDGGALVNLTLPRPDGGNGAEYTFKYENFRFETSLLVEVASGASGSKSVFTTVHSFDL